MPKPIVIRDTDRINCDRCFEWRPLVYTGGGYWCEPCIQEAVASDMIAKPFRWKGKPSPKN